MGKFIESRVNGFEEFLRLGIILTIGLRTLFGKRNPVFFIKREKLDSFKNIYNINSFNMSYANLLLLNNWSNLSVKLMGFN